jgi:hypothetical protein
MFSADSCEAVVMQGGLDVVVRVFQNLAIYWSSLSHLKQCARILRNLITERGNFFPFFFFFFFFF